MEKDLRLYEYSSGSLTKVRSKYHKHRTEQSVRDTIKYLWTSAHGKKINRKKQYVLVEYTAPYCSKLLKTYNYPS